MRGPAVFLAQFVGDQAPFNSFPSLCSWAAGLGYRGVQVPTSEPHLFDLELAAESQTYCDEIAGVAREAGVEITELSTHLQGQLIAVHRAYDELFDAFAPAALRGNPSARLSWAQNQLRCAAKASARLGLSSHATFSGAFMWHLFYPWPPRPAGLVDEGFAALAERWLPILNAFEDAGVDLCFELHPGEDLHDGISFERFLQAVGQHPRANILFDPSHLLLQQLDYVQFIDIYHSRIKAFHVKDAEFRPNGRSGLYGGFQDWRDRPGRFRSLGDGQVDFRAIFSRLSRHDYAGWAVMEWECCLKHPEDGAREGAKFIADHMIRLTERAFDDLAVVASNPKLNRRVLGLE